MTGEEGALAAQWLGLDTAIICHYMDPEGQEDVRQFLNILAKEPLDGSQPIHSMALRPGEVFDYDPPHSSIT
jgi:hypothetical protein